MSRETQEKRGEILGKLEPKMKTETTFTPDEIHQQAARKVLIPTAAKAYCEGNPNATDAMGHEAIEHEVEQRQLEETETPFRLTPWRVVKSEDGFRQVWTRQDDAPGSRNNYVVADGIQDEREAFLIASSPAVWDALKAALKIMERHWRDVEQAGGLGHENYLRGIKPIFEQARAALKLAGEA